MASCNIDEKHALPEVHVNSVDHVHIEPTIPVVTRDGYRLHPQPTSDPLDPLNWSSLQKHTILAVIMSCCFMFTYITTTTVPSFPELQALYNASFEQINWTVGVPALGLAVGPLLVCSIADTCGRRIIMICSVVTLLASTVGAALAPTYSGYMAARFFQGLGVSPFPIVGLSMISDMFFEYERGSKIGLWALSLDLGLLVGPLAGGYIDLVGQIWIQWLVAILFGAILIAMILFMPETLYPRNHMLLRLPYAGVTSHAAATVEVDKTRRSLDSPSCEALPRTKTLPYINVKPVPGIRYPKPWDALVRFLLTWRYVTISLPTMIYACTWYWWILCVITMIPSAYATYSAQTQGLFFVGLIIGTLVSEVLCSGSLSDKIVARLARANGGRREAEMRLWLIYPAAIISAIGFIVWGISIEQGYHWIVGQVAFFLLGAGIQMGLTIVAAYVCDAYPLQCMSTILFLTVVLNISVFISPFFIAPWVAASGYAWAFSVQGIITFCAGLGLFGLLHWMGSAIRQRQGSPSWINSEFDTIL